MGKNDREDVSARQYGETEFCLPGLTVDAAELCKAMSMEKMKPSALTYTLNDSITASSQSFRTVISSSASFLMNLTRHSWPVAAFV
jgi:hypothetical protein